MNLIHSGLNYLRKEFEIIWEKNFVLCSSQAREKQDYTPQGSLYFNNNNQNMCPYLQVDIDTLKQCPNNSTKVPKVPED